jgi:hypothetical protein
MLLLSEVFSNSVHYTIAQNQEKRHNPPHSHF